MSPGEQPETGTRHDHAIVPRSINPAVRPGLLRHSGYETVSSRKGYLFDGITGDCMKHTNAVRALKLLGKGPYEIVGGERLGVGRTGVGGKALHSGGYGRSGPLRIVTRPSRTAGIG